MKYCNIIPLIGGMTIGNRQATGNDPEFIVSWDAFSLGSTSWEGAVLLLALLVMV